MNNKTKELSSFLVVKEEYLRDFTTIRDLERLIKEVTKKVNNNTLLYRGEPRDYDISSCSPTILRQSDIVNDTSFEPKLICNFRRIYGNKEYKKSDNEVISVDEMKLIDILTLMQHYGFPTRLLDWSLDLKIALYFACSQYPNEGDGILYILVPSFSLIEFNETVSYFTGMSEITNTECEHRKFWLKIAKDNNLKPTNHRILLGYVYQPCLQLTKRADLQKSVFTYHLWYTETDGEHLKLQTSPTGIGNGYYKQLVFVLHIPKKYKALICNELDKNYQINIASIYPELVYERRLDFLK